jgi:Cna protein B-type domain protein
MLLIGIIPAAYAVESGADSTQPEKTVSEGTDSIDPTEPTEPTEPPDIINPQDDYAVMSVGSTQKSILLFDYADNGNYTTVLKSQVSCEYKPNGTGAARTAYIKNLGWHFARYGGVAYPDEPLYCIEPWRNYGASTSGNSVDRGVTLDGSGSTAGSNVWYAMPEDYREAIGLILLYSDRMWDHSVSVTTTKKDSNPNVPLRIATQFLIYEIVCGLRDPATFKSNSVNSCGTSGDIFYNAGEASVPYFAPKYNALVDAIQGAKKIPSFTGASVSSAPTITLTGEETAVTDSNGVLFNFSFTDGNGAKFYKSGNTLYITQTGDISESTVYKAARNLPSASDSTYRIWYMSGSSYQTTVSLNTASAGSLNAYFKLKAAPRPGSIRLTKTTEDGKNLSGWKFGIYSDAACTKLVSGPHTTDSGGKISAAGLSAGTYYVKELGHTDSAVGEMYYCSGANPQKVTVTAGAAATVSFTNKRNTGGVKIIKTMPDGGSTAGWKFEVYDSNHKLVGSYTTASDGTILTDYLLPGTYTVKEIIPEDSPYTCDAPNPQTVTISAGQTAEVTFTNRMKPGEIRIQKTDTHGEPLAGAEFLLEWSKDGQQWQKVTYTDSPDVTEGTCATEGLADGKLTSGADGVVRFTGLYSGSLYRVTEVKAPKGYQLLTEPVYEGSIQKDDGNFIRLTVVNAPVFELPMTGSTGYTAMTAIQVGTGVVLLLILIRLAKKRK